MKAYSVLLQHNDGRFLVYVVTAPDANMAIDACFRAELRENSAASFKLSNATEIDLREPMKIMDSGADKLY